MSSAIIPDKVTAGELCLTEETVRMYGLEKWASAFSLMTAGYRDHIDPEFAASPDVPFNSVTVAIMAAAKGLVQLRRQGGKPGEVHIGGEVRANTQTFIQIAARVYAAQGFQVHMRRGLATTPIWYSSFGIFYEEFLSGDNFTASHSPYFKLGWKVADGEGKQMTEEEEEIIQTVRQLVANRSTIPMASWTDSGNIHSDFDVDAAYASYQRTVLGPDVFRDIAEASAAGFRCAAYTLGGSMGATTKLIFSRLGIAPESIQYYLDKEDSRFHRVGEIGDHNYGADVGKMEVCANTGAPEKLLSGEIGIALLWDPDGDRLNILTTAPVELRKLAIDSGLTLGSDDGAKMVVYLSPNQLYLILADYRINLLRKQGLLKQHNWFVGTTFPTSMAIEELAAQEGVPTIRVPVGFRNLGDLCRTLEQKLGAEQVFTTLTGQQVKLGASPRALILCEESGGAALGGPELLRSRTGKLSMLALREKDGMQLALMAWAAAAYLRTSGSSMAEQYCRLLSERNLQYRYSTRLDVALYNESLAAAELKKAKEAGIAKRDQAVGFFKSAATGGAPEEEVRKQLASVNPGASAEALSTIQLAAWIGDGSMFEMTGARLIIRASGTDAVLRFYIETTSRERLAALERFIGGFQL